MAIGLLAATAVNSRGEDPQPTPPPTPLPTPVVTPTVSFIPPLSVEDCSELLKRALQLLPEKDRAPLEPGIAASVRSMAETTANYLSFRDDLHTSLVHYNWSELGKGWVQNDPGRADSDMFKFDPPIRSISALSLDTMGGDVWLHRLEIWDEKDSKRQEFDYREAPKLLRADLPRRDVFHLWRRTTISRVRVEYSRANPPEGGIRAGVVLYGGATRTNRPEHVKTAIWFLHEAVASIDTKDWAAARYKIAEATENIEDYLRRNRPR